MEGTIDYRGVLKQSRFSQRGERVSSLFQLTIKALINETPNLLCCLYMRVDDSCCACIDCRRQNGVISRWGSDDGKHGSLGMEIDGLYNIGQLFTGERRMFCIDPYPVGARYCHSFGHMNGWYTDAIAKEASTRIFHNMSKGGYQVARLMQASSTKGGILMKFMRFPVGVHAVSMVVSVVTWIVWEAQRKTESASSCFLCIDRWGSRGQTIYPLLKSICGAFNPAFPIELDQT